MLVLFFYLFGFYFFTPFLDTFLIFQLVAYDFFIFSNTKQLFLLTRFNILILTIPKGDMMKCSNCGSEFDDGLNFCPHCGTSAHVITCPQCGEKYNNVGVYCPNCGYKLKEDSNEHVGHVENVERVSDSIKGGLGSSDSNFNGGSNSHRQGSIFNGRSNSRRSSSGIRINPNVLKEHPWATGIACCCIGLLILSLIGGVLSPDTNTSDYSDYNSNYFDDYSSNLSDDLSSSYNSSSSYDDDSSYSSDSSSDHTYDYDNIVFDNDGDNKLSLEEYAAMAVDLGYTSDDAEILADIFDRFDTNHDGYWDIDEYNAFLNS